jgi:parvulin-like peptidyl-prolyl isomerase
MPKKKRLQPTAPPLTRGQLSRAERERRQTRNFYAAMIGVGTLVVLILGFSVFTAFVLRPNEEVASVNGVKITRATYNKLRRWNVFQQNQSQQFSGQTGAGSIDPNQLRNVESETNLDATTVNQLIDSEVLRQKAASDHQITASQEDLKATALKDFIPSPTPPATPATPGTPVSDSPTVTGTTPFTPTATATFTVGPPTQTPTKTPTLPPVPGAQETAQAGYDRYLKSIGSSTSPNANDTFCAAGCPNLSEQDYLNIIIQPRVLQEKVVEKFASTIITQVEQIHAQHILTDTEEGARKIVAMLDAGADFTRTANEQSSEQISNRQSGAQPNGGDLGWFPKEGSNLVKEFVDAAFQVETGKYNREPAKTQFGYHIIKVLERDPKRPLSDADIETRKNQLYQDWFDQAKASSTITTKVEGAAPVATQPPITEPTALPLTLVPASPEATPGSGGTPSPAGSPAATSPPVDSTPTEPGGAPAGTPAP